jgi:hypothetical protein
VAASCLRCVLIDHNRPLLAQIYKIFLKLFALHCNTLYICLMKEEILNIRIDVELKKKLQAMADKDSRTLSDFVRLQLKKLAEKGK